MFRGSAGRYIEMQSRSPFPLSPPHSPPGPLPSSERSWHDVKTLFNLPSKPIPAAPAEGLCDLTPQSSLDSLTSSPLHKHEDPKAQQAAYSRTRTSPLVLDIISKVVPLLHRQVGANEMTIENVEKDTAQEFIAVSGGLEAHGWKDLRLITSCC